MLIELKDKQILSHVMRIQRLVVKISLTFKLSDEVMKSLLLLAQFHDVGKLGIPDSILFKESPLTENEFTKMKQHSEIGHRITEASSELFNIAHLILKHHEWWNGEGYPLGLKGDEIPFECRILAIIDAFDAMTHSRPYRNAISHKEAIEELTRCAGTQFDPFILRELKEILHCPFLDYQSSWQ
jgi:HD-GYP domain-containing protein (c-di-GMP phosphodiesterase class II)